MMFIVVYKHLPQPLNNTQIDQNRIRAVSNNSGDLVVIES